MVTQECLCGAGHAGREVPEDTAHEDLLVHLENHALQLLKPEKLNLWWLTWVLMGRMCVSTSQGYMILVSVTAFLGWDEMNPSH